MVLNDDESPLIYGLEFPARAMCAQTSIQTDPMPIRFLVGTQSLKNDNQVHVIEFMEDCGHNLIAGQSGHNLSHNSASGSAFKKVILKHMAGEIWDISCHSKHPNLFTTCHADTSQANNVRYTCTLWQSPIDLSASFLDEESTSNNLLIKVHEFSSSSNDQNIYQNNIKHSLWHPDDASQLLTMDPNQLLIWDVEQKKLNMKLDVNVNKKSSPITATRWSPHSNCCVIGFGLGKNLYAKDVRCATENEFAWTIDNAHGDTVRDLDFNPNAQYHLVSCGDDCEYKFWDVRNAKVPAVVMSSQHSHWVWSVRYNQYHDQLVLSCSSDSRVILSRIASFASQPFGHLMDDQDLSSAEEDDDDDADNKLIRKDADNEDTEDNDNELNNSELNLRATSDEDNEIDINDRSPVRLFDKKANKKSSKYRKNKVDEVISVYEEHEDSVYSAEWSNADPWVFASLSYDGRFVLNRVPKEEKYNLLI